MKDDFRQFYSMLTPRERRAAGGVLAIMVLAAVLQVAAVGSIHPVLNAVSLVQSPDPQALQQNQLLAFLWDLGGFHSELTFLAVLALGSMVLIVLSNAALAGSDWAQARFQHRITHSLSVRLMRRYLSREYAFFLGRNTAELRKNILGEASQITNSLVKPALKFASNAMVLVGLVLLIFVLDPLAAILVFGVVGGGYLAAYQLIQHRLEKLGREYVAANRERFKVTDEAFGAIKDVKLMGRELFFLDRFEPESRTYNTRLAKRRLYQIVPKYLIEALAFGGLMAALVFFILTGRPVARIIPIMGLFAFAGYRMMPAFEQMLKAASSFRFVDELSTILEADLEELTEDVVLSIETRDGSDDPLPLGREIRLEGVTYKYPGQRDPALEEIDLTIPRNASIGVVGPTGAGKTTLIDILLGLLTPTEGRLMVDDTEVTPANVHRWQMNLGYVPQEISLIDDTVTRNIAFGIPGEEIDPTAIRRVAKIAQIHDFIEQELPEGYETEVGERGVRLSGGQRQRIGIARALYHDPPVLILDEATSDIDGETEATIAQGIRDLAGDKTVVMVAHRLGSIRSCDRVYLLEDGRVSAEGTYDSLLEESERFRAMVHGGER